MGTTCRAARETSYSRRPTKKLSVGQECRAPPCQLLAHKRLRRAGLGSMSKARFAQRFVEHRLPRSRDNGRCSPVLYGREGAAQHEGSPSCDRSEWPSSVASNGCHRRSIPNRCYRPSDALAGSIAGWIGEGVHEVGSGRDIESQLSGASVTKFRGRSSSAP